MRKLDSPILPSRKALRPSKNVEVLLQKLDVGSELHRSVSNYLAVPMADPVFQQLSAQLNNLNERRKLHLANRQFIEWQRALVQGLYLVTLTAHQGSAANQEELNIVRLVKKALTEVGEFRDRFFLEELIEELCPKPFDEAFISFGSLANLFIASACIGYFGKIVW